MELLLRVWFFSLFAIGAVMTIGQMFRLKVIKENMAITFLWSGYCLIVFLITLSIYKEVYWYTGSIVVFGMIYHFVMNSK